MHDAPDSSRIDQILIDAWVVELNVVNWYIWIPYKTPQQ